MQEMQKTQVHPLGLEDTREKEMATHSSTLAWRIPWTEEPGRLQSMASQRVGHDLTIEHAHTHTHRKNQSLFLEHTQTIFGSLGQISLQVMSHSQNFLTDQ